MNSMSEMLVIKSAAWLDCDQKMQDYSDKHTALSIILTIYIVDKFRNKLVNTFCPHNKRELVHTYTSRATMQYKDGLKDFGLGPLQCRFW